MQNKKIKKNIIFIKLKNISKPTVCKQHSDPAWISIHSSPPDIQYNKKHTPIQIGEKRPPCFEALACLQGWIEYV